MGGIFNLKPQERCLKERDRDSMSSCPANHTAESDFPEGVALFLISASQAEAWLYTMCYCFYSNSLFCRDIH